MELVLIEKDAKLTGRVVAATARTDFSPESRLQVVIERAEWRGHSVMLNAFVVAQGQLIQTVKAPCNERSPGRTRSDANSPGFVLCAEKGDTILRTQASPMMKDVQVVYE